MAVQGVVILVLATTVVQRGEEFDHVEVRAGLRSQQTPVLKYAQPVIPTAEAPTSQSMACDPKLEEVRRQPNRESTQVTWGLGLLPMMRWI